MQTSSLLLMQLWASFVIKVEKERGLGPWVSRPPLTLVKTKEAQSPKVACGGG